MRVALDVKAHCVFKAMERAVVEEHATLRSDGVFFSAIIVSPLAKKGTVDRTQYDPASILRLITRPFDLDTLPGLADRDAAPKAGGGQTMGDLTNALNLQ